MVWIEHHPPIATDGDTETFDLVTFSGYEVRERGPYLGETRLTLGEATWKRITRGMVEMLVGGEVWGRPSIRASLAGLGTGTLGRCLNGRKNTPGARRRLRATARTDGRSERAGT